ncbi:MAG: DMT family transporter [Thermoanaerobaculia bacterium]
MRFWLFLVLSALLQVGWLVSLRETQGFSRLGPLLLYGLFGFTSTFFLSRALEAIPMSTAYAVWTGISVLGSVLLDASHHRAPSPARLLCILLILAGTTGLKLSETRAANTALAAPGPASP